MRTSVALAILSAIGASAAPGLSLTVTGPNAVTNVENLAVKTVLKNTGDVELKVCTT